MFSCDTKKFSFEKKKIFFPKTNKMGLSLLFYKTTQERKKKKRGRGKEGEGRKRKRGRERERERENKE